MESKVKYTYDDALKLKTVGSVAITSTETTAKVGFDRITAGRGIAAGQAGSKSFDVVLHITALDHTTGDETYSLAFQTFDSAGANGTTQETITLTTADIGLTKVFKFDTSTLLDVHTAGAQIGIVVTLGGTTPILQYWAFVVPNRAFG